MPKKKAGKKKKGKKKKKMIGNETPEKVVKRLLKTYERCCQQAGSLISHTVRSSLKLCVQDEKLLEKVFIVIFYFCVNDLFTVSVCIMHVHVSALYYMVL